ADAAPRLSEEKLGEVTHPRLDPAADVHDRVRRLRLGREQIRSYHIRHVYEVHRRAAITEQGERLVLVDEVEPADHHFDVLRSHVHARSVDVEVAERRRREIAQMRERAPHLFVRDLRGAVYRRRIRGLVLVYRQSPRLPVHDGARGQDDALHLRVGRGLEHVERAVDHDLLAFARVLLAAGPPQRGLMEHDVGAVDVRAHRFAVADVDLDEARLPRADRVLEVLRDAAHEGVERDGLARALADDRIDDLRADVTGAAGHDDPRAAEAAHSATWIDRRRAASLIPPSSVTIRQPKRSANARYSAS